MHTWRRRSAASCSGVFSWKRCCWMPCMNAKGVTMSWHGMHGCSVSQLQHPMQHAQPSLTSTCLREQLFDATRAIQVHQALVALVNQAGTEGRQAELRNGAVVKDLHGQGSSMPANSKGISLARNSAANGLAKQTH